jgi:hypothetical protein
MSIAAGPAGIARGTVRVACSCPASSVTVAVWVRPAAAIVTVSNSISAAFSTIAVDGFARATLMRTEPPKAAAARFGSTRMS